MLTAPALTESDITFLSSATVAAGAGGCIWPDFMACEAALESGFGQSSLARMDNNLFGMKQHRHPVYGTVALPTQEFLGGHWVRVSADWVKYPTVADCFADRMATLRALAPAYQHYAAALAAQDGPTFVREVSQTWSTDPSRAQKVLDIYKLWRTT
jgi:flagellum-specific peptidoglycan hydrolase FlgJ